MFPVSAPGSVAWQPDPRLALVARHSDFLEVRAPGALQQVPADGGYVTDLTGGPPIVDLDDTRLPFDDHGDLTFIVLVRTSSGLLYEGEGVAEVGWERVPRWADWCAPPLALLIAPQAWRGLRPGQVGPEAAT
jgi:hypothetical protein